MKKEVQGMLAAGVQQLLEKATEAVLWDWNYHLLQMLAKDCMLLV
uniref:Uncharacterized protein n=1 Tax=Arundo donax TaxID=35708 RepID=A0A0A8ZFB6_ARUDO